MSKTGLSDRSGGQSGELWFTRQDLIKFIKEQPADRSVSFGKNTALAGDDCGCLLIHFAREKMGMKGSIEASYDGVREHEQGGLTIGQLSAQGGSVFGMILSCVAQKPSTYGEIVKLLDL